MKGEIISVAQMRAIDQAALDAGVTTLMDNAGRAVAEAVMARFTPRPTAVLCGPGNNGGDGWVAARVLRQNGWPVWIETLVKRETLKGDAADAAAAWSGETFALGANAPKAELIIDALFGAGLTRPLEGEAARAVRDMAAAPERVVAVDVPSGIDGDTGAPIGEAFARAALTVTFVRKKAAHVLYPSRAHCGEIVLADIGAPEAAVAAQNVMLFENGPDLWGDAFPWPSIDAHKHARGHAMIASGGHTRTGAARLAAQAALRAGAGLVTVLSPRDALAENAAQLTAVMLREATNGGYAAAASKGQALVMGPAFGTDAAHKAQLDEALSARARCPLVLDADGITLLAPLTRKLDPRDVLTPHVGEFKRAFPGLLEQSKTRIDAAREAAQRAGCVVLLKGPDTVIASPDGRAAVNTSGTPFLATAGSGDVLAGIIAGLIAQGMASFEAAAAGAWLHGQAAERFGPGLTGEDICDCLPFVLNRLAPQGLKARP